jgi:hypothetical protein
MAFNFGSAGGGLSGATSMNGAKVINLPVDIETCRGKYGAWICDTVDAADDYKDKIIYQNKDSVLVNTRQNAV